MNCTRCHLPIRTPDVPTYIEHKPYHPVGACAREIVCARCGRPIEGGEPNIGCYRYGLPLHHIVDCACAKCSERIGSDDQFTVDQSDRPVHHVCPKERRKKR